MATKYTTLTRALLIVGAVGLLASCASIVEGDTQVVSVSTPDCPGAACELTNNAGTFYVNPTPGTVTVNKSRSALSITCKKGEHSRTISTESGTEGMTFGNILFGGLIGAAVDAGTGAMYVYDAAVKHPLSCPGEVDASKRGSAASNLEAAKETCLELGFKKETEKYADCVIRLATH